MTPLRYAFALSLQPHATALRCGQAHGAKCLLVGSENGQLSLYDLRSLRLISHVQEACNSPVKSCGFFGDGVWAYFRGSFVKFWRLGMDRSVEFAGECAVSHDGFCGVAVAYCPTFGKEILVCPNDDKDGWASLYVRSVASFEILSQADLRQSTLISSKNSAVIFCLCVVEEATVGSGSLQGLHVFFGTLSGAVHCWKISTKDLACEHRLHADVVTSIAFSAQDSIGATSSPADGLCIWRLEKNYTMVKLRLISHKRQAITALVFATDTIMASASSGTIELFSVKGGKRRGIIKFHKSSISCIERSFNFDENVLLASSNDGIVSCWKM